MDRAAYAALVNTASAKLGYAHPYALLADAAQSYHSTEAHNSRAMDAALDLLLMVLPLLCD